MICKTLLGNDLARVLRWGPGYTGGEDPLNLLRDVIDAEEIRLDRWTVVFHPEDKPEDPALLKAPSTSAGKKKKVQQSQQSQQNQHHHAAITSSQSQGQLMSKLNSKQNKKRPKLKFLLKLEFFVYILLIIILDFTILIKLSFLLLETKFKISREKKTR